MRGNERTRFSRHEYFLKLTPRIRIGFEYAHYRLGTVLPPNLFVAIVRLLLLLLFSHSVVSDSAIPWTVAHQASLSMKFPRQEHWSGLLLRPPGDLSNTEIEPMFPALAGGFFPAEPPGKPQLLYFITIL